MNTIDNIKTELLWEIGEFLHHDWRGRSDRNGGREGSDHNGGREESDRNGGREESGRNGGREGSDRNGGRGRNGHGGADRGHETNGGVQALEQPSAAGGGFPPSRFDGGRNNPVLTHHDVTDYGGANFVADPFLYRDGDTWHLFMEVYNHRRPSPGAIGHATSRDWDSWEYDQIVLQSSDHLSFPYVFEWEGDQYMLPDRWSMSRGRPSPITLYRAREFPTEWTEAATIVSPTEACHDFVVFRWRGRWWALGGDGWNLWAYYADELERDDWTPHSENPVVEDRPRAARPGGRPLVRDESVLAFFQDCSRRYGEQLRGYEVTSLTPDTYADEEVPESPVLEPNSKRLGWNTGAMHTLDYHYDGDNWYCVVDGDVDFGWRFVADHWSIGTAVFSDT